MNSQSESTEVLLQDEATCWGDTTGDRMQIDKIETTG